MPQNYGKSKSGRSLTYWQRLVQQHGIKKARKHYVGYRQKSGKLKYKGDVTRQQNKSGTYKNVDSGQAWHLERGIGSPAFVKTGRVGAGVNEEEKWEMNRARKDGLLGGLLG